jgi:UDP-N-acetylglucosamine diphosphorylase / glucose-1-phosphate thymidylyltransferase / UDP-N-acetylgalactosamine diphosphorylase / glucosamine-1-phosphate N-acetyltransferase / galactosamine-1-phosphate N-acetyltransferase
MKAVVLARGLGTRMRASDPDARLSDVQRAAADAGLKAMIPVNGRPFLDYVLGALADAGVAEVGLVVAPDHDEVRRHYAEVPPARIDLSFVVQAAARGTADAVLAAASWTNGEPFLAMNADNLYPVVALAQLAALQEPGLLAFERDDLVRTGNIPAGRVQSFAVLDVDADGYLARIVEKPASLDHPEILVSMNCWRFDSRIFDACGAVPRSPRGEFELPEAVALATARGMRFRVLRVAGPVLDLSRRADTADVERRLAGVEPRP